MRSSAVLLAALCMSTGLYSQNCLDGYSFLGVYNGHHYYLSDYPVNPSAAYGEAAAAGAYLASITSAGENAWLAARVPAYITIGLSDAASEGNFVWDSGEPLSYSNWWPGEPNNVGNEDYTVINFNQTGRWNDVPDWTSQRFIIELDEDSDQDGILDRCDPCPNDPSNDADGDGVCGAVDNCPDQPNADQADSDCDGYGDACDQCPGGDDSVDNNHDGLPDCLHYPGFNQLQPDWICAPNKVLIAKRPPGNPDNCHNICVNKNAVQAHLKNGSYAGPCANCNDENRSSVPNMPGTQAQSLRPGAVFPNPSFGECRVILPEFSSGMASVQIFTMTGALVYDHSFNNHAHTAIVNTLDLEPGIYTLIVRAEGQLYTEKLVIQR